MWRALLLTRRAAGAVVVMALFCVATPALADQGPGWTARFFGQWVSPALDFELVEDFGELGRETVRLDANPRPGLGLGLEYRFSRMLGVELSADWSEPQVRLRFVDEWLGETDTFTFTGDLSMLRVGLAVPIHLTPNSRLDLWLAPSVSWVSFGKLDFGFGEGISTRDEAALGGILGLDYPLSDRWALHLGATYHDLRLRLRLDDDLDDFDDPDDGEVFPLSHRFDPLTARFGVSLRF
jgi:hypothetical protein